MNVLIGCTPATGHLNPILAIARMLVAEGHEVAVLSGTCFRGRVEECGARFFGLSGEADFDGRDLLRVAPELATMAPGPEWLRYALERLFVDKIPDQYDSLRSALAHFPADLILGDDMFFGVLPMLLNAADRLPIILFGTSFLHWRREDKGPNFVGLPPATTQAQRDDFARLAQEQDGLVHRPVSIRLNAVLKQLGARASALPLFESVVELADTYVQLTVPGFEFTRSFPKSVRFVGALPIIPNQVPLPSWARDLDGTRKVVLVTQGTVANHDFNLLVAPTLAALANEPDILVVATAGGRPVDAIPGAIPHNARVAGYLPFEWLLPMVDAVVTNGGYGSVNQALSYGIPIVAAGMTEDKADVNARIEWSAAGINLKTNNPTREAIRNAVRSVLDDPAARSSARRLANEFASYDAKAEIIRLVNAYGHKEARRAEAPHWKAGGLGQASTEAGQRH